jgi:hypothetical protein
VNSLWVILHQQFAGGAAVIVPNKPCIAYPEPIEQIRLHRWTSSWGAPNALETLSACSHDPVAPADELPIQDVLAIKHDVVPLDGADVFQQREIDSAAVWIAKA